MFTHYIETNAPSAKRGKYPPIKANITTYDAFNTVKQYLTENGYEGITANEEFNDIFAKDGIYEISISIATNMGASLIQISVYSEKRINHIKKTFKKIYSDLEDKLENYI